MKMLNDYMQILLQHGVIDTHPQLQRMLLAFLEQGDYDKGVTGGQIARTVTASDICDTVGVKCCSRSYTKLQTALALLTYSVG